MRKAIYKNPKSGKFYCIIEEGQEGATKLYTVFDNAKKYDSAELKEDKKGRAYKVLDIEPRTTKAGYSVYVTV